MSLDDLPQKCRYCSGTGRLRTTASTYMIVCFHCGGLGVDPHIDRLGRRLFVSDGISGGKTFCTFYRKPNGSLKRLKSKHLPLRDSRAAAEADLRLWMEGERR